MARTRPADEFDPDAPPADPLDEAIRHAQDLELSLSHCRSRLRSLREQLVKLAQARTAANAQAVADEQARNFEIPEPRPRGPRFPGDETWDC